MVPLPIDERVIAKIRFIKKNDKNSMPLCKEYDPHSACDKQVDTRSLEELKLKPAARNPNSCFFSFHDGPTELTVDEEMIYLRFTLSESNVQLKQLFNVQSNVQDSIPF